MKTDHEHSFGRNIIACLATALGICAAVEIICLSLGIAPLFTPNLPINEKMRFLRDHRLGSAPIAVVSGASIALNDIDSDLLEDEEKRPFVNLGANGISVPTSEEFYKQLADLYSVREVIFAASPVELRDAYRSDVEVPTPVFRRYVLGRMTMAEEFTYRDISGLMSYWENWSDYHSRTSPTSMVFTKTGAVPLEIGPGAPESRTGISEALGLSPHCTRCMSDMAQFCRDVRSAGLPFTVVLGPVRPDVLEQTAKVRAVVADRKAQIRAIVQECKAQLFDITDYATLDNSCFANSLHLNAQGMSAMTAQFERYRRGESIANGTALTCGSRSVRLATSSVTSHQGESGARASE
ncbi:MAG: SGNH/GDSL hydrolase family protein [Terriglobales bacterium]